MEARPLSGGGSQPPLLSTRHWHRGLERAARGFGESATFGLTPLDRIGRSFAQIRQFRSIEPVGQADTDGRNRTTGPRLGPEASTMHLIRRARLLTLASLGLTAGLTLTTGCQTWTAG